MQKIEIAHNGAPKTGRSGIIAPHAIDARPLTTAVLCRQFPTRIHRAVSSPKRCGSIIMYLTFASNAFSNSFSNVSCSSPSYTSRITCVEIDLSSLQNKRNESEKKTNRDKKSFYCNQIFFRFAMKAKRKV